MTQATQNGNTALVEYETEHGKIALSPDIIRKYLVSGDANVTHQEVTMFLALCKYQRLNPFLREAYLIKYSEKEPATIVTGKEVFTKRAAASELCNGWDDGIIVKADKGVEYRDGAFKLPEETLVGGWASVYRKDWERPIKSTVSLDEYLRRKNDGTPMANWKSMPCTMIKKVALVQALREAYPEELGGMVSQEEMDVDNSLLDTQPVKVETLDVSPGKQQEEEQGAGKPEKTISKPQAKRLFAKSNGNQSLVRAVMDDYGYESADDIKVSDYDEICEKVEARASEQPEQPEEPGDDGLTDEQRAELDAEVGEQEGIFK